MQYIYKSSATAAASVAQITQSVQSMLEHIEKNDEEAVIDVQWAS